MINIKYVLGGIIFLIVLSCGHDDEIQIPEEEQVEESETFKNPVLVRGADPWVIKNEDKYYYTHTTGNRLELRETEKMEELGAANPVTIWTSPIGEVYSKQIWAPELHLVSGKWYMYFAATFDDGNPNGVNENRRMFVLENTSASPMNTNWEFKGKVADETDHWAIDGTVLEIEDERYFIWSGWRTRNHASNTGRQQLYIARMSNPWTLEDSRVMISEPEYEWEKMGLVNEGPVIWRNPDGEIFLFYSGSGCWTDEYKIGMLSLIDVEAPLNPDSWKKHSSPLFEKSQTNRVFGPGHNSFFKSPDGSEDWILYHANDNPGEGCGSTRKPRIQKIGWSEEGLPELGVPVNSGTEIPVPSNE